MSERSGGFTSMADAKAAGTVPEVGVGMLGYAFMGEGAQPCHVDHSPHDVPTPGYSQIDRGGGAQ